MSAPKRIQRKRTQGWRMPEGQYVRRAEVRANPGTWTTKARASAEAVRLYSDELTYWLGGRMRLDASFWLAVMQLDGCDLACWCPLDQPCHADVLLDLTGATL